MKKVTAALIGAGQRGAQVYAGYALKYPDELAITALAEPDDSRRERFCAMHGIPPENAFNSWEELLDVPRLADCALVCTQDRMHAKPAIRALELGYDVLCEKPMSPLREEILAMAGAARKSGNMLTVCHVLRYSAFYGEIKRIINSGSLGGLVSIQQTEGVGYWHQAHSFVRGNWRMADETSPMIMAKCCHDMDIIMWLAQSRCLSVCSYGSLKHFRRENMPEGAPARCLDGCPHRDGCPYYAPRFYFSERGKGFCSALSVDPSCEAVMESLKTGPYGRCVYQCDNDVVDNQVTSMIFENGVSASLTMCAFTSECERTISVMLSKGRVRGNMDRGVILIDSFATGVTQRIELNTPREGHSGSDELMMKDFVASVRRGDKASASSAPMSVESHLMALAAERSRVEGRAVALLELR